MIVVRIELWSASTGEKTELARMHISNVGGTIARGNYEGQTYLGRSTAALDQGKVNRRAAVSEWPRQQKHVWFLLAKMLSRMGYGP